MAYSVLIVDDSSFILARLKKIIEEHPKLELAGTATNGHEAIEMARKLKPDVISMDYEMPFLDGVTAVKTIMAENPVPIIMFSSMTYEGAQITLDALAAGAVDFIPKNFAEVSRNADGLKKRYTSLLVTLASRGRGEALLKPSLGLSKSQESKPRASPLASAAKKIQTKRSIKNKIKVVIIGASTGGPVALTEVLGKLPVQFSYPVIVIQHMPENFTKALAQRLNKQCAIQVVEAENGNSLTPGKVYVAPGGKQLMLDAGGSIKIINGDERVNYKPSVDVAFASAANVYGASVLGLVLTGMGSDGRDGARLLKEKGSYIWAQDEQSSVIFGMPKAVISENLADEILPLTQIGDRIVREI